MLYTEPRRLSRMRSNGNKVATKRGNIVFTGQRCRYISVLFIVFFFRGGGGRLKVSFNIRSSNNMLSLLMLKTTFKTVRVFLETLLKCFQC